jgi:hypothetical protein
MLYFSQIVVNVTTVGSVDLTTILFKAVSSNCGILLLTCIFNQINTNIPVVGIDVFTIVGKGSALKALEITNFFPIAVFPLAVSTSLLCAEKIIP